MAHQHLKLTSGPSQSLSLIRSIPSLTFRCVAAAVVMTAIQAGWLSTARGSFILQSAGGHYSYSVGNTGASGDFVLLAAPQFQFDENIHHTPSGTDWHLRGGGYATFSRTAFSIGMPIDTLVEGTGAPTLRTSGGLRVGVGMNLQYLADDFVTIQPPDNRAHEYWDISFRAKVRGYIAPGDSIVTGLDVQFADGRPFDHFPVERTETLSTPGDFNYLIEASKRIDFRPFHGTHFASGFTLSWTIRKGAGSGGTSFITFDDPDLTGTYVSPDAASVPEPSTVWMFGAGFIGLGLLRRRHSQVAH